MSESHKNTRKRTRRESGESLRPPNKKVKQPPGTSANCPLNETRVPSPALEVTVSTAASLPRQRKRRACPIDVAITDEELRREYCLGAELGQGGYGKVVRADKIVRWRRFKRPKTVPVAIKYMPDDAYVAMSRFKDRIIPTEVHYLRKCHHVNIIELLAHYIMLDNEQTSRHVIVMERPAHCLDLFSFLEIQPRGRVKEKGARKIFRDVMRGVKYLDQRGILHNDIKPENILLEVEPADKTSTRPRCSERESATFPAIAGPSVEHASASGGSSTQCAFANKPKVIRAKLLDFGFATGRNADPKVSKFRDASELLQKLLEKAAFWRMSLESISQDPWLTRG
ncbi:testis-specific serine/threonine-protein kinase 3 [Nematostella vectensis]|uniref:testis-specific serine/threonine-protein kinase 3 n=1 Tax=Nematostella vectensis TaxID=45351 RepID=UPI0013901A76|nr:testis-specific serine/threonine-protein kinase 3 [Nematostella vectensis]